MLLYNSIHFVLICNTTRHLCVAALHSGGRGDRGQKEI